MSYNHRNDVRNAPLSGELLESIKDSMGLRYPGLNRKDTRFIDCRCMDDPQDHKYRCWHVGTHPEILAGLVDSSGFQLVAEELVHIAYDHGVGVPRFPRNELAVIIMCKSGRHRREPVKEIAFVWLGSRGIDVWTDILSAHGHWEYTRRGKFGNCPECNHAAEWSGRWDRYMRQARRDLDERLAKYMKSQHRELVDHLEDPNAQSCIGWVQEDRRTDSRPDTASTSTTEPAVPPLWSREHVVVPEPPNWPPPRAGPPKGPPKQAEDDGKVPDRHKTNLQRLTASIHEAAMLGPKKDMDKAPTPNHTGPTVEPSEEHSRAFDELEESLTGKKREKDRRRRLQRVSPSASTCRAEDAAASERIRKAEEDVFEDGGGPLCPRRRWKGS